jgi:hypothetical protein
MPNTCVKQRCYSMGTFSCHDHTASQIIGGNIINDTIIHNNHPVDSGIRRIYDEHLVSPVRHEQIPNLIGASTVGDGELNSRHGASWLSLRSYLARRQPF